MRYFDTSFLAPLILAEATSADVERFMAVPMPGELAVSHWTRVEFASLLAREVRTGGLERAAAREAAEMFETVIAESFAVLLPSAEDFDTARRFLDEPGTGLRAGDALHLAIARNNAAETIYTFDKTMLKAANIFGLSANDGFVRQAGAGDA